MATFVSVVTYMFWGMLPKGSFYVGNALYIMLLCSYLYFQDRRSGVKFILFALSINNFADETLFNNATLDTTEIIVGASILIFTIIKKCHDE